MRRRFVLLALAGALRREALLPAQLPRARTVPARASAGVVLRVAEELPPGWQEAFDDAQGLAYYYNAATGVSQWERPAAPAPAPEQTPAGAAAPGAGELEAEMRDLLAEVTDRGAGAPADVAEDIREVAEELEAAGPPDWARSPLLPGRWRLAYTSARTFAQNRGLTGYARDLAGVETPETFMTVEMQFRRVVFEEPLALKDGTLAATVGRFANADAVKTNGVWTDKDGVMRIDVQEVSVGDRSWEPFDRQAKAIRTLQFPRPVYLGPKLLVMTSPPENVWVFTKP